MNILILASLVGSYVGSTIQKSRTLKEKRFVETETVDLRLLLLLLSSVKLATLLRIERLTEV